MAQMRIEHDGYGEVRIPENALYGAHTQRAVDNFPISGLTLPPRLIHALGALKAECARVNGELSLIPVNKAVAIARAADRVAAGEHDDAFPVDVFQTGSGTSTNMNVNEVIAALAAQEGVTVHPNDDVNYGQSSNDVFPTVLHLAAADACAQVLLPGLAALARTIRGRAEELDDVTVTGRTHLMDAMPVRLSQVLGGWASQVEAAQQRVGQAQHRVCAVVLGGTAVGTGINTHREFADMVCQHLARRFNLPVRVTDDRFAGMSALDEVVGLSGAVRTAAVALMKIANDLRWMNSGPIAGLGEISLPALQAGSSIMPGKVNPVIPESVAMVCAQVIGHDATIALAGQSGNFQLNVMLPVVAYDLVNAIEWLGRAAAVLADKAIAGFTVNREAIQSRLSRNPILITALNARVGYDLGARIAKTAYAQGRPLIDVAAEMTELERGELERLLDPDQLTRGGIPG